MEHHPLSSMIFLRTNGMICQFSIQQIGCQEPGEVLRACRGPLRDSATLPHFRLNVCKVLTWETSRKEKRGNTEVSHMPHLYCQIGQFFLHEVLKPSAETRRFMAWRQTFTSTSDELLKAHLTCMNPTSAYILKFHDDNMSPFTASFKAGNRALFSNLSK